MFGGAHARHYGRTWMSARIVLCDAHARHYGPTAMFADAMGPRYSFARIGRRRARPALRPHLDVRSDR
jgi:hypothetical protein